MTNARLKTYARGAMVVLAAVSVLNATAVAGASGAPNKGTPGSPCQATNQTVPKPALPAGWSTTKLGAAPGYYEVGPAQTGAPKGVMILIHGGGWYTNGPAAAAVMRPQAGLWTANGWDVVNISSTGSCAHWPGDVAWFYDHVHAVWPSLPICALGQSAGAHLALLLASMRPGLACAISEAGPTDLVKIGSEKAYSPDGAGQTWGPGLVEGWAAAAFGQDALAARSPATYTKSIKARILLGIAADDPVIPQQQSSDFVRALDVASPLTRHESYVLRAGSAYFVHANVSPSDLAAFQMRELEIANNTGGLKLL